jgi:hypothetical protein
MDYRKIDAALAGALEESTGASTLQVFIHSAAPLTEAQGAELAALGVPVLTAGKTVLTATVRSDLIAKLSELPCVSRISLARKLRPLE